MEDKGNNIIAVGRLLFMLNVDAVYAQRGENTTASRETAVHL